MEMLRTRFARDVVTEFLPPMRRGGARAKAVVTHDGAGRLRARRAADGKKQRVIILCDGMPSIPRKQPLAEFLAANGYWVFYPRYRGAWESGGEFLARSPHEDILDVIAGLQKEFREAAFGQRFRVRADEIFVIGGSFGGAAAILASLDERVKKAVANCPVVDWGILRKAEKAETSNPSYTAYIREAFGACYKLSERNWRKLYTGKFYNPAHHANEVDPSKIIMFHAQDDPSVAYQSVVKFAKRTGVKLKLLRRGGHLSTDMIVRKYWPQIQRFFES